MFWKSPPPPQQQPSQININFVVGSVDIPTENDYKVLKSDIIVYKSLHKILDHRIANAFHDIGNTKLTDSELRSMQGYMTALQNLKSLLK